ncbi:MAG: AAA family ATPase [Bacteroides sp.]
MSLTTEIQSELSRAGSDPKLQELLRQLDKRRITPDKEIPPMQFLFEMFCKPCFPRGELVAIAGKAKSGKTFVSSILMTLCFRDEVLTLRRLESEPMSVLWFDTEQSEESTQDILCNRIMPMIGPPEELQSLNLFNTDGIHSFQIFNVRADFWQDRLPLLEAAMHRYQPDLVILDGIRDLVSDINDGVMAQDVIERLMHIASELHCCITCILHQNKSTEDKNLRGWIGTELKNKAFEVYECEKDTDRIFTWRQTDTRKYDILDKLKFTVGDDGIPQLCSVEQLIASTRPPSAKKTTDGRVPINPKYLLGYEGHFPVIDVPVLFTDAFRPGEVKPADALQATVMNMACITSYKFYNRCREEALKQGIIGQYEGTNGHVCYTCPSKPEEPPKEPEKPAMQQLNLFTENESSDGDLPF